MRNGRPEATGHRAVVVSPLAAATQQTALAPQDHIAIQQLASKYAYTIDECTNRGYDYADLYTADGVFRTSRGGKVLNPFAGRERLAEAARGGMPDCKDVPWAGIVHIMANHARAGTRPAGGFPRLTPEPGDAAEVARLNFLPVNSHVAPSV